MRIKYKEGICSRCNKPKLIVNKSKKLCLYCNNTVRLQRSLAKQKLKKQYVATDKMEDFYKTFWKSQPEKRCFETGQQIYKYNKWHIHHILHKNIYPEHTLNPDVCVLLTLEMHSLWHTIAESDRKKLMPHTYNRFLELKHKYYEQSN